MCGDITAHLQAVARGDFTSLESALGATEQRRATLRAELAKRDGKQQTAIIQLTFGAVGHRLPGITEKLRSEVTGKVREAFEQMLAQVLVGVDGNLTIEVKPFGLQGVEIGPAELEREKRQELLQEDAVTSSGIGVLENRNNPSTE